MKMSQIDLIADALTHIQNSETASNHIMIKP